MNIAIFQLRLSRNKGGRSLKGRRAVRQHGQRRLSERVTSTPARLVFIFVAEKLPRLDYASFLTLCVLLLSSSLSTLNSPRLIIGSNVLGRISAPRDSNPSLPSSLQDAGSTSEDAAGRGCTCPPMVLCGSGERRLSHPDGCGVLFWVFFFCFGCWGC